MQQLCKFIVFKPPKWYICLFDDPPTNNLYTLSLHDALPICIRVNRAKKSGMVNITSSVNSRERSGINTTGYIDHAAFLRSEERFSRNAETDIVCRLLLVKKKLASGISKYCLWLHIG